MQFKLFLQPNLFMKAANIGLSIVNCPNDSICQMIQFALIHPFK